MPEMERRPNRGLVEKGQIHPRKKEKSGRLEVPARWTNVSAREMVDTSVVQMFPMQSPEADSRHPMIEPECSNAFFLNYEVAHSIYVNG